jgi:DNA-binding transcriptional MerR regulator
MLGVSEATLRQWTDDGQIKVFITPGGHRRYELRELDEFMSSRRNMLGIKDLIARLEDTASPHREIGSLYATIHSETSLDPEYSQKLALLGRGILDLIIDYTANPENRPESIQRARQIGHEFGLVMAAAEFNLTDAIQAFIAHRKPITEGVITIIKKKMIVAEEIIESLPLIDDIIDQALIALVEAYQQP